MVADTVMDVVEANSAALDIINGQRCQIGHTSTIIFRVWASLVSRLSWAQAIACSNHATLTVVCKRITKSEHPAHKGDKNE